VSVTKSQRAALLSRFSSRRNKMAMIAEYRRQGLQIQYEWMGEPYNSRLAFMFDGDGRWHVAKSYCDDIRPFLKEK
jgi:hypothetical protein